MQNITQLQLLPQVSGNTQAGYVDVTEDTIIPITFSVSDVRDLTQKNGTFSKSIKVRGTKNNNRLFQYYFDVNLNDDNVSFDINKLAFCNVIQNGVIIMDNALLQLVSVNKKQETNLYDDEIEYQLLIKDTTSDFFNIINNKYLEEIDLGLPNNTLTPQLIIDSFTNTNAQGYKYLMGYAGGETGSNSSQANDAILNISEFKPAIFAKRYFDAIFLNAGYRYKWQSMDSTEIRFSKLLIPYNGEEIKGTQIDNSLLSNLDLAGEGTPFIDIRSRYKTVTVPKKTLDFINWVGTKPCPCDIPKLTSALPKKLAPLDDFFDPTNNYNPTTQTFIVPETINSNKSTVSIDMTYDIEFSMVNNAGKLLRLSTDYYDTDGNSTGTFGIRPAVRLVKTDNTMASDYVFLADNKGISQNNRTSYNSGTTVLATANGKKRTIKSKNLKAGDQFYIELSFWCETNGDISWDFEDRIFDTHPTQSEIIYIFVDNSEFVSLDAYYRVKLTNVNLSYQGNVDTSYGNNATVRYNRFIPQKIKQSDFLKSIATMFNLYFEVDKNDSKLINIFGRNEYYDSGLTVDWTQKLDKGTEQELRFLPELQNKQFLLTYKQDSDFANELYFKSTNEVYSQFLYSFDNEYVKDIKKNELVFSPTPIYYHPTLDATLPFINGLEPKNNIRILYDGGIGICNKYKIQAIGSSANDVTATTFTSIYPIATHWDSPTNPDFSIEFGTDDYYFLTNDFGEVTNNNLYNLHWRRTLNTINTGRMFVGYFFLNENDIANLRLNQKVLVNNSYWVINKIIDYDGTQNKTTKVELINIDDKEPAPIFLKQPTKTRDFDFRDLFNRWNNLRNGGWFGGTFSPIRSSGFNNWTFNDSNAVGDIIGNNNNLSGNGFILGDDNIIRSNFNGFHNIAGNGNTSFSDYASIFGSGNFISFDNQFSHISGLNNIISTGTGNSFIFGSGNLINLDNRNTWLLGDNNVVQSGLTNVHLFGSNFTATTSNTSYFDNIIITSGSTINNIPIQAYMGGYNDTGVIDYSGITVASGTQINVPPIAAWFIDNETNPLVPTKERVIYTGQTNVTVPTLSAGFATYVFLKKDKTLFFQNTFPTSAERKTMCFLGKLGHPNGVITVGLNSPDFATSPNAQTRDLWKAFGFINRGVLVTPLSGLTIGRTAGVLYGNGVSFHLQPTIPNEFFVTAQTASQMFYRTQTGGTTGVVSVLDPANYDAGGVVTPVGGGFFNSTIQYVFAVPGAQQYVIQYGQNIYASLADAVAAVGKESFSQFPSLVHNGVLLGVIALTRSATNVNDPAEVRFFNSDIFGQLVGAAGGSPTTSLQGAYNNSSNPEIVENATLQAIQIRGWDNTSSVIEIQDTTGSTKGILYADGRVSGTTFEGTFGTLKGTRTNNSLIIGYNTLVPVTNASNSTVIGSNTQTGVTTTINNTLVGANIMQFATGGNGNTVMGESAMWQSINSNSVVAIGASAGRNITGGVTPLSAASSSIFIGSGVRAQANDQTNQIIIGINSTGLGSNTTLIGTTSTTGATLYGNLMLGTIVNDGVNKLQVSGNTKLDGELQVSGITRMFNSGSTSTLIVTNTGVADNARFINTDTVGNGSATVHSEVNSNTNINYAFQGFVRGTRGNAFQCFSSTGTDPLMHLGNQNPNPATAVIRLEHRNGHGFQSETDGAGDDFYVFHTTNATGRPFRYELNGSDKAYLNHNGDWFAQSYIKSGGTSTQALIADGSVKVLEDGAFSSTTITVSPAGTSAIAVNNSVYSRTGNVVTANLGFSFNVTATTAPATYTFTVPLPINRGSSTQRFIGQANFEGGITRVGSVLDSTATTNGVIRFTKTVNGTESVLCNVTYQYNVTL